ncbi:flippase-like domain-containing protein [Anaerolineae bacterium CFX7]|nr:flippase-like domain-containing protein [Anaerolineae bacterium CFX7]
MRKQKTLWIGVIISLGLLAIVFYGTDLNAIGDAFRTANYFYLVPALVLYFIGVGLRAVRWHFLLRSIKPVGVWRLFQVTVIGYMVNDLLPFRIGELVRAYILGETERISKASVLVTIILERVFDGVTMLLFIGVASFFLPLNEALRTLLLIGSLLFAAVVVALALAAGLRERFDALLRRALSRLPEKWRARGLRLADSFFLGLAVLRNPTDAAAALLFSILAWLFEAGMYATLALGFGIVLPFPVFVLATAVANLVTIVPSTPGYVGVFDVPVKAILALFGVNESIAASYTLLLHAALIVPVVFLGLALMWRLGLSLGQLRKQSARNVALKEM